MNFKLVKIGQDLALESSLFKKPFQIQFAGNRNYWKPLPKKQNEPLFKAIGFKGQPLNILDGTAGLLEDSFQMARLGVRITALERHLILFQLLQDGIRRSIQDKESSDVLKQIRLIHAETEAWLKNEKDIFDVIYLDPMFLLDEVKALPKKENQVLRLLNESEKSQWISLDFLNLALKKCKHRVVIKRSIHTGQIRNEIADWPLPDQVLKLRSVQFEIYFP